MPKSQIKIATIYLVTLILFSCTKKIIEIRPVVMLEKNISIPIADDVNFFSFPSKNIGYAASADSWIIYKTIDGGSSWSNIEVFSPTKKCSGLEFFSNDSGMCLMNNTIYITNNGGVTWYANGSADFIGKTKNNVGIKGECGYFNCEISSTIDNGESFETIGDVVIEGNYLSARVVDSKVFVICEDVFYYDKLYGLDIESGEQVEIVFENLISGERPTDIYIYKDYGAVTGHLGLIAEPDSPVGDEYNRNHYGNAYSFYSVDGFGDLVVAVGEKTIVTNMLNSTSERWTYMTDVDGNGFTETFYKIRFLNENTFYISGSGGTLLKMNI